MQYTAKSVFLVSRALQSAGIHVEGGDCASACNSVAYHHDLEHAIHREISASSEQGAQTGQHLRQAEAFCRWYAAETKTMVSPRETVPARMSFIKPRRQSCSPLSILWSRPSCGALDILRMWTYLLREHFPQPCHKE
eukprot:1161114-Pelagomonas_calceolata.AAC.6